MTATAAPDQTVASVSRGLALALVFTLPFENVLTIPGTGTVTRTLGVLLTASWLLGLFLGRRLRPLHRFHIVAIGFALWNGATILWSVDPSASRDKAITYAMLVVLTVVLWDHFRDQEQVGRLAVAYIAGSWCGALGIFARAATGLVTTFDRRATLPDTNANDIGLTLAIAVPIAWYLAEVAASQDEPNQDKARLFRTRRVVAFHATFVVAGVVAVLLTGSRASIIALAAMVPLIIVRTSRLAPPLRLGFAAGTITSLLAVWFLLPAALRRRILQPIEEFPSNGIRTRVETWEVGLDAWADTPWTIVAGIGSGAFLSISRFVAHQTVLGVLVETGLIGAMAFLALMVITGSSVSMMEPPMRSIGWTAFAVWAIGIQSLTWETQKVSWLLFALVIGAAEAPRSALRMPNPSPPGRRDGRHV